MKRVLLTAALILGLAVPAFAVDIEFHGDLNNRFQLYSNQNSFFNGVGTSRRVDDAIRDDGAEDSNGEIKYRLWTEVSKADGAIKGVYAIEIGRIQFGEDDILGKSTGGSFSGDSVNLETRWACLDFQLPGVQADARVRMGLQPICVNKYLWKETAAGVKYNQDLGMADIELAWMRGYDVNEVDDSSAEDLDGFWGRVNFDHDYGNTGLFALYQVGDEADDAAPGQVDPRGSWYMKNFAKDRDFDLVTVGVDGTFNFNNFFVNYDLMYQDGEINNVQYADLDGNFGAANDYDIEGYMGHVDVGMNVGPTTYTYTFWYTNGDDDPNDGDIEAFLSTDTDLFESVVLFENYTDDNYFNTTPYLLDKGMIFNRFKVDHQISEKLKVSAAAIYYMTAEDIEYEAANGESVSEDTIGTEIDASASYMIYPRTELAVQFGYLFGDDALDYWEEGAIQDGESDEDVFVTNARVRYKF